MNRHILLLLLFCSFFNFSWGQRLNAEKVRKAVLLHQQSYPKLQLQDLYKSFFQAEFGAEHIVSDSTAAGKYLDKELETVDKSTIFYEPIGADSSFIRVHLCAIQKHKITRDQLFHAFLGGVHKVEIPQIKNWVKTWKKMQKIILSMKLNLQNLTSDQQKIQELLDSGEYALHHSDAFQAAYDPHYRIIRKDIFYQELYPYLK